MIGEHNVEGDIPGFIFWEIFTSGLLVYFLALVIFGLASVRDRTLARGNILPILAGSWGLIFSLLEISNLGNHLPLGETIPSVIFALSMLSMVGLGMILKPPPQLETK